MSLTIYKGETNWPVLQSLTETKHLSGLLSVSAEYIRPVGNGALPTSIQTSAGSAAVYPAPTVSKDTSGFEKINATGYRIYDATKSEEVFNISLYSMRVGYFLNFSDGSSESVFVSLPVVIESGWVKKMGDTIPTLSRPLAIVSPTTFAIPVQGNGLVTGTPTLSQYLSMVKQNKYGTVTETEAAYELSAYMNLGSFSV
ncbi:MAG: hypothetical protein EBQ66_01905 [Flavobacteriia bacterium]|nr:hypothetical protein [Flavobacteriia bacterium]